MAAGRLGGAAEADPVAALVTALTTANAGFAALPSTYVGINPVASSYTYNADGTVATETVAGVTTSYTYNADGTVATSTRSGATRTYGYNADGTIASVT